MEIEVDLKKSYLYFFVGVVFILIGLISVYAYGTDNPSYFGHSAGEIDGFVGAIPTGFCIFSATATDCPEGLTKSNLFNGRTIRGADLGIGEIGGSETHRHSLTDEIYTNSGLAISVADNSNTGFASSWPPYINVTICCKI